MTPRRRTPPDLLAERYGQPSHWWPTPPPAPQATLSDDWDVCAGCRRWVLLDVPCPHCRAHREATP